MKFFILACPLEMFYHLKNPKEKKKIINKKTKKKQQKTAKQPSGKVRCSEKVESVIIKRVITLIGKNILSFSSIQPDLNFFQWAFIGITILTQICWSITLTFFITEEQVCHYIKIQKI